MAPKHFFNIISQSAPGGNRRRTKVCAGAAIFVFIAAALCCFASNRLAENKWRRGWASWKEGRTAEALEHWSSGGITAPFERERSRISYWRIRAFEKSGKEKEASVAASLLALRDPLGFYTLVLAHSGRYPAVTRIVHETCGRASYSHRWEREINSASNKTGVSANTLRALICRESKFNERALSRAGAMGLMQLMPVTAKEAAARLKTESISPFEPKHNIILGASHFARLERRFFHRLPLAVAAYNAGASAVSRWENDAEDWVSWIEEIPYKETREYVRAVLRNIEIYNASDKTENAASSFFAGAESRPVFMKRLSSTGNIAGGENQ